MKKNSLTTAIIAGVAGVAGLAGVAQAVNLNPDGIGQVLLYPYYTTNGGHATLITVVNTADVGKAVKVRFLESVNSKEVLDFNLYMSPYDVWSAAIYDEAGAPGMFTADESCIAPNDAMGAFMPFRDYEFSYWRPDKLGVEGSAAVNASRIRQGHIEVIEMGDLIGEAHLHALHNQPQFDCSFFHKQWTQRGQIEGHDTWLEETGGQPLVPNYKKGLHHVVAPGSAYVDPATGDIKTDGEPGQGGIFGSAYIVHGLDGTAYSYNAEAINGFYTIREDAADPLTADDKNLHYAPGTIRPALYDATNSRVAGNYFAQAHVFDAMGNVVDLDFARTAAPQAVSAVLMARFVANEYAVGGDTEAASDWVITFPTKELHTYRANWGTDFTVDPLVAPFTYAQGAGSEDDVGSNKFMGTLSEEFNMAYWDREERRPSTPPGYLDVSPLPPPGEKLTLAFGQEANVLTFHHETVASADAETVFAAPEGPMGGGYKVALEHKTPTDFTEGWARIGFAGTNVADPGDPVALSHRMVDLNGIEIRGLPVIGFWAAKHTNGSAAPGVTAFYNIIHRHRVTRDVSY